MQAEYITWPEYQEAVNSRVIILPTGSMEQHGYHLPLNVDVVIPTSLAKMVAEKVPSLILPTVNYGYKSHSTSGGGQLFPGTTSLDGETYIHLILDILRETYRHGGRRFLNLNGHYENIAFVNEAVELFINESPDAKLVTLSWWDQVSDELVDEIFAGAGFPGWDTEHAAITETALMMFFAPELVLEDKIIDDQSERKPSYSIFPPPPDIIPESGVLYKATFATAEKGKKLAEHVVNEIVRIVQEELSS